MTWLVRALVERGNDVRLITYFPEIDHFLSDIRATGVEPESVQSNSKLSRLRNVRKLIRQDRPDCIISFLHTPNLMGVFSSLRPNRIPVIVSERSLDVYGKTKSNRIRFNAFRFADRVVTNSESQAAFIRKHFSFLSQKIVFIQNSVDLEKFHPQKSTRTNESGFKKILVAASVSSVKNAHGLIRAIRLANDELEAPLVVEWLGRNFFVDGNPTADSEYFLEAQRLVSELGVEEFFRFFDPVSDIHKRMNDYDAICLPSIYEGSPNVVCEAMACGKTVLASDISDISKVLGSSNYLFDPLDDRDIAEKLVAFAKTPNSQLEQIGKRNRKTAEEQFSPKTFADRYQKLVSEVVGN